MELKILVLPGDGIGTEVTREAVRVLEHVADKWGHALTLREGLLGGRGDSRRRDAVSRRDEGARARSRRHAAGGRGTARVRRASAVAAPREGPARHSQGARRLRQSAPGAGLRESARVVSAQERHRPRNRHSDRPRAYRRPVFRATQGHQRLRRGRDGGQLDGLPPFRDRARRAHGPSIWRASAASGLLRSTRRTCSKTRSFGGGR